MRFPLAAPLLICLAATAAAQSALTGRLATPDAPSAAAAPESAWIDLRQTAAAHSKPQAVPDWVEAVTTVPQEQSGDATKTVFRLRLKQPNADARVLMFRLFFEDKPQQQPQLVAWDESGTQLLRSGELGGATGVSISETVMVPMIGVSCIDVEVPGDGSTVRGAYLDWLVSREVLHPAHAEQRQLMPEPFSAAAPLRAPETDSELYGTVIAPLAPETIAIGPSQEQSASFQFAIESQPLLALLTFEVASPDITQPPQIFLNGRELGSVSLTLPDLADPGYRGRAETLMREMTFHYTGWVRAQKLVPAALLNAGTNVLLISSGGASASAIRATQLQLKYLWDKSDYVVQP